MKIPQEIIDKVVAVYYPNYRYLKEAEIDYPIIRGEISTRTNWIHGDFTTYNRC